MTLVQLPNPWLSVDAAAEYLQLSPRSVRNLIAADKLVVARPTPRKVLIHAGELDRYLVDSQNQREHQRCAGRRVGS